MRFLWQFFSVGLVFIRAKDFYLFEKFIVLIKGFSTEVSINERVQKLTYIKRKGIFQEERWTLFHSYILQSYHDLFLNIIPPPSQNGNFLHHTLFVNLWHHLWNWLIRLSITHSSILFRAYGVNKVALSILLKRLVWRRVNRMMNMFQCFRVATMAREGVHILSAGHRELCEGIGHGQMKINS